MTFTVVLLFYQALQNSFRYGRVRLGIGDIADEAKFFYISKQNALLKLGKIR